MGTHADSRALEVLNAVESVHSVLLGSDRFESLRNGAGYPIPDLADRGITLRQLLRVHRLVSEVVLAGRITALVPVADERGGLRMAPMVLTLETFNYYHLEEHLLLPATVAAASRSLVEVMADGPQVPRVFVSHAWSQSFDETVRVVARYYADQGLHEDEPAWIYAFAFPPHARQRQGELLAPRVLERVSGFLSIVDRRGALFTRAWCVVEAYEALSAEHCTTDIYTCTPQAERLTPSGGPGVRRTRPAGSAAFPAARAAVSISVLDAEMSAVEDRGVLVGHVARRGQEFVDSTVRAWYFTVGLVDLLDEEDALDAGFLALQHSQLRRVILCAVPGIADRVVTSLPASTLTYLELDSVDVGPEEAARLATHLGQAASVAELVLPRNQLGDAGVEALASVLDSTRRVDLRGNKVGPKGAEALSAALRRNTVVTDLDLSTNRLRDKGATAVAAMLKVNHTLTTVSLAWNDFAAQGAAALSDALRDNDRITALDVSWNGFGDTGTEALSTAFAGNETIAELLLGSTSMGPTGAAALAAMLRSNGSITRLDVSSNAIRDKGVETIAGMLDVNVSLQVVDLTACAFGEQGAEALSAALRQNASVTSLVVRKNPAIGETGRAALAEAAARRHGLQLFL